MYDPRLVEIICRRFRDEKDARKARELMDFLQAVVTENAAEMNRRLTLILEAEGIGTAYKAN